MLQHIMAVLLPTLNCLADVNNTKGIHLHAASRSNFVTSALNTALGSQGAYVG